MSTHQVAIRWISVAQERPRKGANVLYWNPKGYVEIADEWNDEHHLPFASHWAEIVEPIELQDARDEARDKVTHDLDLQGKMLEVAKLRIKAAEKNAARYLWLKANHLQTGPDSWIRTGDDLEEAVDAAMSEAKQQGPAVGMEWETNDG